MTNNNCDNPPSVTIVRSFLNYLGKHNLQARIIISALSLGFIIAVFFVGYAIVLQAQHNCLTIFSKFRSIGDKNDGNNQ